MAISVKFLGAAQTVTGSCYLVTVDNTRFLVDCGMFQGPDVEEHNFDPLDFDAGKIDFVLLTHTHIDHSGLLPKLIKHGYRGPIYTTFHSSLLVPILLRDSAKIQENNYQTGRPWKFSGRVEMIYSTPDAEATIQQLESVDFNQEFEPVTDIKVKYVKAAHVLGAASIEVEIVKEGKIIVFSGDIGRVNHTLIGGFDTEYKREVDYVIMESLYGGQTHPKRQESVSEMIKIIQDTISAGGNVYIPCFAVQRTQELLHDIKIAKQSGALSNDLPVWLDSPMAQRVTKVYEASFDHSENSIFNFPNLHYVLTGKKSAKVAKGKRQVVIAGSGMADGGRIMQHLAVGLPDKRNTVMFVGYQAEGTLGRELVEGAKQAVIDKRPIPVKATIHHLHGFSAHGDTNDYQAWVNRYKSPRLKKVILVHSDIDRSRLLEEQLKENNISNTYIPKLRDVVDL